MLQDNFKLKKSLLTVAAALRPTLAMFEEPLLEMLEDDKTSATPSVLVSGGANKKKWANLEAKEIKKLFVVLRALKKRRDGRGRVHGASRHSRDLARSAERSC